MNNHQTRHILACIEEDIQAIRDTGNIGVSHQAAARASVLVSVVRRSVEKDEKLDEETLASAKQAHADVKALVGDVNRLIEKHKALLALLEEWQLFTYANMTSPPTNNPEWEIWTGDFQALVNKGKNICNSSTLTANE